jgi:hypothetical protein
LDLKELIEKCKAALRMDSKGQMNPLALGMIIMSLSIAIIMGTLSIAIWALVNNAIPTTLVPTAAITLINIAPILLAAGLLLGALAAIGGLVGFMSFRR